MDYSQVFAIGAAGLNVQKTRLEIASFNLAHMHTVKTASGMPFQPLKVVASTGASLPIGFDSVMTGEAAKLPAVSVVPDVSAQPRLAHEPGHPNADKNGMVSYPGVNHLEQMMAITEALRAYEANIAAIQAGKTMATRALDIGGRQ